MGLSGARSLILATLACTAPAAIRAQTGAPPPAPAFEIDPFRFLVGLWRGAGTFMDGKPLTSTMKFELASRTTMAVRMQEDAPDTFRYAALWSRERNSGQLVMLMSSSFDGPAIFRSAGWRGDRLVFEPAPGIDTGVSKVRFTYVKTGERSFDLTYEFSVDGRWLVGDRQRFVRTG